MRLSKIFVLIIMVSLTCSCFADDSVGLEYSISGVWHRNNTIEPNATNNFSWGESATVINSALEIDLLGEEKHILLPALGGPFHVTDLSEESENTLQITFYFDRGKFDVKYLIHFNKKDEIWIESKSPEPLIPVGEQNPYFKISGP